MRRGLSLGWHAVRWPNNLPAMKNPMPTSRSATTRITNVTRKSRAFEARRRAFGWCSDRGGRSFGVCRDEQLSRSARKARGATAGAAGQALRQKASSPTGQARQLLPVLNLPSVQLDRRSEQAWSSRTRVSRARGNDVSLGDIDAELKETNKKLDTIDADLKVQTAAIQGLNCDVNVGNMNADRSTVPAAGTSSSLTYASQCPIPRRRFSLGSSNRLRIGRTRHSRKDDNGLGRRLIPIQNWFDGRRSEQRC